MTSLDDLSLKSHVAYCSLVVVIGQRIQGCFFSKLLIDLSFLKVLYFLGSIFQSHAGLGAQPYGVSLLTLKGDPGLVCIFFVVWSAAVGDTASLGSRHDYNIAY